MWGKGVAVETPNIDWIAEHSAIADRFYGTSPVCTPSRAAMMTGRYPQNTGAITNNAPMAGGMLKCVDDNIGRFSPRCVRQA